MKRKIAIIVLIVTLVVTLLSCVGCGAPYDARKKIVVTIFPVYDWVMNVLGDKASDYSVTLLLDSGADLHSYQPSVADMVAVAGADLFLYVGGESDKWVPDALKNATNNNMRKMDLLALLGDRAKTEEIVEGMEHEEEEGEEDEEDAEYDEHVWLSLKNAAYYVGLISAQLQEMDPQNASLYLANAREYISILRSLDARYETMVKASPRNTILFGDRFPFRYLAEDYGLTYYAAFVGCSAETNASVKTLSFLATKADELDLNVILKIESSTSDIAEGVRSQTARKDQEILVLDSLQSANKKEYAEGRNYLSVMTSNLEVLKKALN